MRGTQFSCFCLPTVNGPERSVSREARQQRTQGHSTGVNHDVLRLVIAKVSKWGLAENATA